MLLIFLNLGGNEQNGFINLKYVFVYYNNWYSGCGHRFAWSSVPNLTPDDSNVPSVDRTSSELNLTDSQACTIFLMHFN